MVGILMDKSHEKMQQQNETIEKQEQDIKDIKEEKSVLSLELNLLKVRFWKSFD